MVIFLAGAHGVGKSFLGRPVAESLGIKYATASTLIREELGSANWDDGKRVQDVDRNQEALISAVSRIRDGGSTLLLDGHFVLRDKNGALNLLNLDVFRRLGIHGAILLEAPSNVVASRLAERGAPQALSDIDELASGELNHGSNSCSALEIPLFRLSSPTESQLYAVIEKLLS